MSINFSIQQISAGLASFGAGLILGKSDTGGLTHFGIVGAIAVATSFVCIFLSKRIRNVEGGAASPAQELSFEGA